MKRSMKLGLTTLVIGLGLFVVPNSTVQASTTHLGNGVYCGDTWESCEVRWGENIRATVDRSVQRWSTALVPGAGYPTLPNP